MLIRVVLINNRRLRGIQRQVRDLIFRRIRLVYIWLKILNMLSRLRGRGYIKIRYRRGMQAAHSTIETKPIQHKPPNQ